MLVSPVQAFLIVLFLAVATQYARGEPVKESDATWEQAARETGLSDTDIATLEKNRILVTNDAYKQSFSAYLSSDKPLFITSDSLLNAYHVLFEESVLRLETTMADRLPDILGLILKNLHDIDAGLKGRPALVSAAKERAMLIPGIALRLMNDHFRFGTDNLDTILKEETARIVAANGYGMPKWLGNPDPSFMGLDYSRYQPRGFYTRSEQLQRYFRAVSWLQSIPFRISNDEEFLAILMLGNSVTYSRLDASGDLDKRKGIEAFFRTYRLFIGAGDDWDLMTAAQEVKDRLQMDLGDNDLQGKRDLLRKKAENHGEGPLINDQIRFPPDNPTKVAEPNFRIISAYRTPDAILFQRTTDLRRFNRPYPDGLEVTISLGSAFARKTLTAADKKQLLETIDWCRPYLHGDSLYLNYLHALEALLDAPERGAPDFMKNDAWQAKSCNTALGGWAQLRHTWALQAKQTVHYACVTMVPEGFVEPEPEFFSRMADLAAATRRLLKDSGAFNADYADAIEAIGRFKAILERVKDENELDEALKRLPLEDRMAMELPRTLIEMVRPQVKSGSKEYFRQKARWLDAVVMNIKKGQLGGLPRIKAVLQEYDFDLEPLWGTFEQVSRSLEAIARKQLNGVELDSRETGFIRGYGEICARIMLYGGNSYVKPTDDAPRVVDVYANPQERGYLHVGVARARRIYVLYPWQGRTILCQGAIMPYYEVVTKSRLTDKTWQDMLDSPQCPSIPKWMSPVVNGGCLGAAKIRDTH